MDRALSWWHVPRPDWRRLFGLVVHRHCLRPLKRILDDVDGGAGRANQEDLRVASQPTSPRDGGGTPGQFKPTFRRPI